MNIGAAPRREDRKALKAWGFPAPNQPCIEPAAGFPNTIRRRRDRDPPTFASGLPLGTNRVHSAAPRVARPCPVWNNGGSGIMQTALRLLDKDMMDKQRALDAALGQIERAFGKGSIMKLGSREAALDIDVISTGSLGL